ncbi:hypothetical protein hairong_155 [Pseudomonas phage hairong]|nr:hypothetical protein hairong_155 [Pseudomonas phage hairong]
MSLSDIWGAKEDGPPKKQKRRYHFDPLLRTDVKEAMSLIHHKVMAMHDEYDDLETEVDNEGLRATTMLYPNAWQAVMDLNPSFFYERPHSAHRVCMVADALLEITLHEWMDMAAKRSKINLREDETEGEA